MINCGDAPYNKDTGSTERKVHRYKEYQSTDMLWKNDFILKNMWLSCFPNREAGREKEKK